MERYPGGEELGMRAIPLEQLRAVWKGILADKDARKALVELERAGFRIGHLSPGDPTFSHPNWADMVAGIPLVPCRAARRRIHRSSANRYRKLVKEMREFAAAEKHPFCSLAIATAEANRATENRRVLADRIEEAASLVEKFTSWDWYIRERNPRNALIAELRWTIRDRTGSPHDPQLQKLIDAAFRAAGKEKTEYIEPTTLDRIEKREKESRVKATKRLVPFRHPPRKSL